MKKSLLDDSKIGSQCHFYEKIPVNIVFNLWKMNQMKPHLIATSIGNFLRWLVYYIKRNKYLNGDYLPYS